MRSGKKLPFAPLSCNQPLHTHACMSDFGSRVKSWPEKTSCKDGTWRLCAGLMCASQPCFQGSKSSARATGNRLQSMPTNLQQWSGEGVNNTMIRKCFDHARHASACPCKVAIIAVLTCSSAMSGGYQPASDTDILACLLLACTSVLRQQMWKRGHFKKIARVRHCASR